MHGRNTASGFRLHSHSLGLCNEATLHEYAFYGIVAFDSKQRHASIELVAENFACALHLPPLQIAVETNHASALHSRPLPLPF